MKPNSQIFLKLAFNFLSLTPSPPHMGVCLKNIYPFEAEIKQ